MADKLMYIPNDDTQKCMLTPLQLFFMKIRDGNDFMPNPMRLKTVGLLRTQYNPTQPVLK